MAEPVLMAAWPNGNSGGTRTRTGWREKSRRKAEAEMPFSIPVAGADFLTIWFTVLFARLPFGGRSRHETGDIAAGAYPGAPVAPRLVRKAIRDNFDLGGRFRHATRLPILQAEFRIY